MTTNLSRRTFFGAAAGTTALGLGMFRTVSAAEAKDIKWDETKKFVIIGTGFAGLAAALEAYENGLKADEIAILEKMPTPGGSVCPKIHVSKS